MRIRQVIAPVAVVIASLGGAAATSHHLGTSMAAGGNHPGASEQALTATDILNAIKGGGHSPGQDISEGLGEGCADYPPCRNG